MEEDLKLFAMIDRPCKAALCAHCTEPLVFADSLPIITDYDPMNQKFVVSTACVCRPECMLGWLTERNYNSRIVALATQAIMQWYTSGVLPKSALPQRTLAKFGGIFDLSEESDRLVFYRSQTKFTQVIEHTFPCILQSTVIEARMGISRSAPSLLRRPLVRQEPLLTETSTGEKPVLLNDILALATELGTAGGVTSTAAATAAAASAAASASAISASATVSASTSEIVSAAVKRAKKESSAPSRVPRPQSIRGPVDLSKFSIFKKM